jgi:hypothetical protein
VEILCGQMKGAERIASIHLLRLAHS